MIYLNITMFIKIKMCIQDVICIFILQQRIAMLIKILYIVMFIVLKTRLINNK